MQEWSNKWLLKFNASKCKVMRLGVNQPDFVYQMLSSNGITVLDVTTLEKDLGIHVDDKLRLKSHAELAVAKANRILGLIRRSYEFLDANCLKNLYIGLVRPHLEYGHTVWPLNYKTDRTIVENVQHRATKLVPELKNLPYTERLEKLNLPSIAYRRCRGDMIEVYKYLNGKYAVDLSFLPRSMNSNRCHSFKLQKQHSKYKLRHDFFSLRVVDLWNSLPESVVSSPSINSFKNRLDKFWHKHKYNEVPPCIKSHYSTEEISDSEEQSTGL